jgi:hypothetical protein
MRHIACISAGLVLLAASSAHAESGRQVVSVEHGTARCMARVPAAKVCEVSAVSRVGERLVLTNDKPIPDAASSPLFSLGLDNRRITDQAPVYLNDPAIEQSRKLEALTRTLDGRYLIASTAFNRVGDEQDATYDGFSTLLYWPVEQPGQARVVSPSTRQGITSSRGLREQIGAALGASFFQVAGLSVAPGNRLLLGIRKQGRDFRDAVDVFRVLAAPFSLQGGELRLTGSFELLFEFSPKAPGSEQVLGLSSIEYDRYNEDALFALTSFEHGNTISGYLWSIPMPQLLERQPLVPQLLGDGTGAPLRFGNKPEGLEVLDANTLLIVHDDDHVQVTSSADSQASGPGEFAYSTVRF